MNAKMIKRKLKEIHEKFINSIDNEEIAEILKNKSFITGGSIVSLLLNEEPNDYDYYLFDKKSTKKVAEYYVDIFNKENSGLDAKVDEIGDRIKIYIPHIGIAHNTYQDGYKPIFLSSNAITLSNKIQIIIRFYGNPEEIHENYDYVHCTCYYIPWKNELVLPQAALESILTRELKYIGSKYPLASIIRARKFIKKGWNINAGQYLKMILQCNQLDLSDPLVLDEQLTGVDLVLFKRVIDYIRYKQEEDKSFKITIEWISDVVDKVFEEEGIDYINEKNEELQ